MTRCGRSFQSVPVHRRRRCQLTRCLPDAAEGPPGAVAGAGVVKEVPERTADLHAQPVRPVYAELLTFFHDGATEPPGCG